MKRHLFLKTIAVIMIFCYAFSCSSFSSFATSSADLGSTREDLEQKLEEVNKKLDELGTESRETEEYLDALDEKISYLKTQYSYAKKEVSSIDGKVKSLEKQIEKNEYEIGKAKEEITALEKQVEELNLAFDKVYNAYCSRLRAIYISGSTSSILELLFSSTGISDLLTRYEMVSAVTNQDLELLKKFREQSTEIVEKTDELRQRHDELADDQKKLSQDKRSLTTNRAELVQKQSELEIKQANIMEQQDEANALLRELHKKTQKYGEFRDITQEELDEIDRAIELADKKYQQTTTTTTTTTTAATTNVTTTQSHEDEPESATKPKPTTTTTTTTQQTSKYINMTYPCPSYPNITCAFGAYSGHTGCDFSTRGNVNQSVVAAESGTVIISADLTNPDGSYRSYGRYIVIRHDKTTSRGEVVYTLYAHNNKRLVSEGEYVSKGQKIALSGSTGNSTGPHLHFEVRVGGATQSYAVDPEKYLP